MSITPNPTRDIGDSRCSICGRLLLVNDQAIVREGMANGKPLIIASCCADLFLGGYIQDYAKVLNSEIYAGHWIKRQSCSRIARIIDALESVLCAYILAKTNPLLSVMHDSESGGDHAA